MNKSSLYIVIAISLVLSFGCKTTEKTARSVKVEEYSFHFEKADLFTEVMDKAQREQKMIFLDMSASWCAPCQLMKRDVYTHQETADFFNESFVNFLVDAEKGEGPDLKLIYNIKNYPTLLIIDHKGRVLARKEGGTFHRELMEFGKKALRENARM